MPGPEQIAMAYGGLTALPEPKSMIERVLCHTMDDPWVRRVPKPGLLVSTMLFPAAAACQLFVE
jgi:hypothetical protein